MCDFFQCDFFVCDFFAVVCNDFTCRLLTNIIDNFLKSRFSYAMHTKFGKCNARNAFYKYTRKTPQRFAG